MARDTTVWETLEPSGWGTSSYGSPSNEPSALAIHMRGGYGDVSTKWTEWSE